MPHRLQVAAEPSQHVEVLTVLTASQAGMRQHGAAQGVVVDEGCCLFACRIHGCGVHLKVRVKWAVWPALALGRRPTYY